MILNLFFPTGGLRSYRRPPRSLYCINKSSYSIAAARAPCKTKTISEPKHVPPAQSGINSLFPKDWSAEQIQKAIRQAYRYSSKAGGIEGGRVLLEGKSGGMTIRMYLNLAGKIIESAWPK
jgi:hypothetical protein